MVSKNIPFQNGRPKGGKIEIRHKLLSVLFYLSQRTHKKTLIPQRTVGLTQGHHHTHTRGYLAVSQEMFGCHSQQREEYYHLWVKARDGARISYNLDV